MGDRQTADDIRRMVQGNQQRGNVRGKFYGFFGGECAEGTLRRQGLSHARRKAIAKAVIKHGGENQHVPGTGIYVPLDHIGINDVYGKDSYKKFLKIADKVDGGAGVRRKKAEAEAKENERREKRAREKAEADARKRPGGSGKKKPCLKEKVPGPSKVSTTRPTKGSTMCEPTSSGGSRGVGVLLALGGVAAAVAVSFIVTHAAAINTVLTYLAIALLVAVVARPLWSLRDQLPDINWGYIPVWWQHRQQRRAIEASNVASLDAKRAEWQERVRVDSEPIALPSARPSQMHEAIVRDWVEAPSRHVR